MMKQANFLPEDYIEKRAQRRTNIVCLILFVVVMVGVAGGFMVTDRHQRLVDERMSQINKEMRQASASLQQLKMLEGKREEMMKKASISASLMEPVPRSLLLATVTNDLPAGVSLTEFELASKDVSQKSSASASRVRRTRNKISPSSNTVTASGAGEVVVPKRWETIMEITGLAPTDIQVAQFIAQLHKSNLFQEVNLVYSEEHEIEEEILREFKLMLILDPEVRASEEEVAEARQKYITGMK